MKSTALASATLHGSRLLGAGELPYRQLKSHITVRAVRASMVVCSKGSSHRTARRMGESWQCRSMLCSLLKMREMDKRRRRSGDILGHISSKICIDPPMVAFSKFTSQAFDSDGNPSRLRQNSGLAHEDIDSRHKFRAWYDVDRIVKYAKESTQHLKVELCPPPVTALGVVLEEVRCQSLAYQQYSPKPRKLVLGSWCRSSCGTIGEWA